MSEHEESKLLHEYLDLLSIKHTHISNETFTTSWNQKRKNKEAGVSKGVPDYMCLIANTIVFIELKRVKGGKVSPEQKEWLEELNKCEGVYGYVAKGFDEAKKIIDKHVVKKKGIQKL